MHGLKARFPVDGRSFDDDYIVVNAEFSGEEMIMPATNTDEAAVGEFGVRCPKSIETPLRDEGHPLKGCRGYSHAHEGQILGECGPKTPSWGLITPSAFPFHSQDVGKMTDVS